MHYALALSLAVVIGITLGLLGGGGSILTVPTLVYVMNVEPKTGIAMSLPVVGVTSVVAGVKHWRAGQVDLRAAAGFGVMAMIGSLSSARAARLVPGVVQLTLLGVVMLGAAAMMLRRSTPPNGGAESSARHPALLALVGLLVGGLTGLVGIGGGFLFVPALVLLGGVPMKRAVGTSLIVIAMNTAAAAVGYRDQAASDWLLVAAFTLCTVGGSLIGARLVTRVSTGALRRWFAWFLVVMAVFILWENRTVVLRPGVALHPSAVRSK